MSIENLKVVLVGESGVGKTSIITQYISQKFYEDQQITTGASYSNKLVLCDDTKTLKFEIWDTVGEEKYRSLTKMFYKDAKAAVMVYDVTRQESFNELKNFWSVQIKESSPEDIILVIAGNKSDLIGQEVVDEEEARNFAKEKNAIFFSTSATNCEVINNLFEEIAKKYTGATKITIVEEGGDSQPPPPEETNDNIKIESGNNNNKKKKKKGFC